MNIKKILTNWKVVLLFIFLILSVVAIHPDFWSEGVAIRTVGANSSASLAGIESPKPTATPMSREVILSINNIPIKDSADYYDVFKSIKPNVSIQLKTTKGLYRLKVKSDQIDPTKPDLGISIYDAPSTNIRKGLDLQGGTRVLLEPEEKLSDDDMEILLANMNQRLNVYGLTDVVSRQANDLQGNKFILIEVAGANEEEVKDLLSKQGKFEAKVGNSSVFKGGDDITYVCRSADCSGLDPQRACGQSEDNQWVCTFQFAITLSKEAAERQARATENLQIIDDYLSEDLSLYLDDQLVDTLKIGTDLKGRAVTNIAISGPGVGLTQQQAVFEALKNMKSLQTVLITGSLPVKLNVVKTDMISPVLGKEFVKSTLIMGVLAILAVTLVIFIKYRKAQLVVPIIFTAVSEVVILLGIAALIGWNIDIAAIAGILVAVGTGVDDQIIITDEATRKEYKAIYSWKQRLKRAFFIIFAAYFTTIVAMAPLLFAGAGLLKGFALTTIIGVTVGVFITRPAYAAVVEELLKEE
ncbi:hypothetical protein ACFLZ7_04465 [Nanoarchaeota archaeon]